MSIQELIKLYPLAFAGLLTLPFAVLTLYHWRLASRAATAIRKNATLLMRIYLAREDTKSGWTDSDYEKVVSRLIGAGYHASDERVRRLIVSNLRGANNAYKQKLASHIELMPQWGLLGTVVGLAINLIRNDLSIPSLGLALLTTLIGLVGAILAKRGLEIPAEDHYWRVMELLANDAVVQVLVQRYTPEQP